MQADSPLTQQGTQLAALEAEVGRLALAAKEQAVPAANARLGAACVRCKRAFTGYRAGHSAPG